MGRDWGSCRNGPYTYGNTDTTGINSSCTDANRIRAEPDWDMAEPVQDEAGGMPPKKCNDGGRTNIGLHREPVGIV